VDYEEIAIKGDRLIVRKVIGCKETDYEFNTRLVKIEPPGKGQKVFSICQSDMKVEVGQFVRKEQLTALLKVIKNSL
jgi:uncharacterized membrane protein